MSEIQEGDPKWQRSPSSRSVKSLLSNNVSPNVIDAQPSWLTPPKHTFTDLESPDGSSVSKSKRRSTVRVPVESESNDTCCGCCPSDPVLYWFRIFHFISGFLGFASAAVNVYVMISNKSLGMVDLIIHAYTIMLCAAVVLAELDWRFFMAQVKILDSWIFRGLFYGFVGVLTSKNPAILQRALNSSEQFNFLLQLQYLTRACRRCRSRQLPCWWWGLHKQCLESCICSW